MTACEVHAPQLGAHIAAPEVRAHQLQACTSISVICGACITVHEVRTCQFGARMAAREVRHLRFDGDASGGAIRFNGDVSGCTWPKGDASGHTCLEGDASGHAVRLKGDMSGRTVMMVSYTCHRYLTCRPPAIVSALLAICQIFRTHCSGHPCQPPSIALLSPDWFHPRHLPATPPRQYVRYSRC